MKINRLYHRVRAFLGGYFWLPCPKCGNDFGGHEWDCHQIGVTTADRRITLGVCNQCAKEIASRHPSGAQIRVDANTFEEHETGWFYGEEWKPLSESSIKTKGLRVSSFWKP